MKKIKSTMVALMAAALAINFTACDNNAGKGEKQWESETVEHHNFTDLGNYVIELPDYTENAVEKAGLQSLNAMIDHLKKSGGGCTAMAKHNSKGEVIIGRNMDLDISQCPAFIFKTTYGKYKTFGVSYFPNAYPHYKDMQQMEALDSTLLAMVPYISSDNLNEKGLYMEVNLREREDKLLNYGLHSTHGETMRDDGTPWSELRAPVISLGLLASQNCATVKEVVAFAKNSYDWYTTVSYGSAYSKINMAFLIGDATGEFGLLEIAQDEVKYIPYQYGQANFYIQPKWAALQDFGPGNGRLAMVSNVIEEPQTLDEMMDAMIPIMWRNETLWLGETKRVTKDRHPYSQIVFQDKDGNPSMDWRSEYVFQCPVLDDGRMLLPAHTYEEAKMSTGYDPNILAYFDDAIARGQMIVDDGSIKFDVKGQSLTLDELTAKNKEYEMERDEAKMSELKPYEDVYRRLILKMNDPWLHNDEHFEAARALAYAQVHLRHNADGEFDANGMSQYDKLCAFYGMGVEKDEKPLRDDGGIWTTSLNIGVNCAQKEMKIRFWENDSIIYHYKW